MMPHSIDPPIAIILQVKGLTRGMKAYRFDLSVIILQKLDTLKVTGPHALRFVSDAQLVENGGMDIG
jgi:hypothetical protein